VPPAALAERAGTLAYLTVLLHQVILVALAATSGVMAVLMLGLHGGPAITKTVTLYAFFGYCLVPGEHPGGSCDACPAGRP